MSEDDKLKEMRKTNDHNKKMLGLFEKFLEKHIPDSQYALYSLEYIQRNNNDIVELWEITYDLFHRIGDLEIDNKKIKKRLDALENNG